MLNSCVVIGLCDPKSPTNVGSVMRAVGCYGADEVIYTGRRFDRAAKYRTDTQNVKSKAPLRKVADFARYRSAELSLICVEFVEGATPLPSFEHPSRAVYVFGPEDGSIDQRLIDQAQHVIYVPTRGCMNLAASVNVVLYDRLSKSAQEYDDASILDNRDVNNRLKLRFEK